MSGTTTLDGIRQLLEPYVAADVDETSRQRLALLVLGIIQAKSAAPAQIAKALATLGLSEATAESIERRIRRIENDPEISATLCLHPLARQRLLLGQPQHLLLILDPSTQDDRIVIVTVAVWYRGRALPLAWVTWPGNTPLLHERFWVRIAALLDTVAPLLPVGVTITWLADRAFGTPAFTDLVTSHGWHYVVRVQEQTRCRDRRGREQAVAAWLRHPGDRRKLRGQLFKTRGWREASLVGYWSPACPKPLCVVSDLRPAWYLLKLYRRRYAVEALFRHYKSYGWHWEQGQVGDLSHVERLLVGMALATWLALSVGTAVAAEYLAQRPTGHRRTRPWVGKQSLFTLGLQRLAAMVCGGAQVQLAWWFTDWDAPNWEDQITFYHARAFVFAWDNGL